MNHSGFLLCCACKVLDDMGKQWCCSKGLIPCARHTVCSVQEAFGSFHINNIVQTVVLATPQFFLCFRDRLPNWLKTAMTSSPKLLVSMTLDCRWWDVACLGGILAPDIERGSCLDVWKFVCWAMWQHKQKMSHLGPERILEVHNHMTTLQQIIVNVWTLSTASVRCFVPRTCRQTQIAAL